MSLKCHKCESTNTKVVSAEKLSEETGDMSFNTAAFGTISPIMLLPVLGKLFSALGKMFGFLQEKEKNKRQVIVCMDCGYWEKI